MAPQRQILSHGCEHWRHGPIDLVIQAWGESAAVAQAHATAWSRFQQVLGELVGELAALRTPISAMRAVDGPVARRMLAACAAYAPDFITPMAAVAGSVADEVIECFARPGIARAFVNNGGDIAVHLAAGESLKVGIVPHACLPEIDGYVTLLADGPVRGVATSGWRGRSFSLGIADSVTVLAATAAAADAAATMIANAVDVEHPAIRRLPACEVKDDSDLGDRLVTVDVGSLPDRLVASALDRGQLKAASLLARGLIVGAALALQKQWRSVGCADPAWPHMLEAQRAA